MAFKKESGQEHQKKKSVIRIPAEEIAEVGSPRGDGRRAFVFKTTDKDGKVSTGWLHTAPANPPPKNSEPKKEPKSTAVFENLLSVAIIALVILGILWFRVIRDNQIKKKISDAYGTSDCMEFAETESELQICFEEFDSLFNKAKRYCSKKNEFNCDDFSTHRSAQSTYELCMVVRNRDVNHLDGDNDGKACESLN